MDLGFEQGSTQFKKIPVMDIKEYQHNYRLTENPKRNEIKESIRNVGLQTVISVTKIPGENAYTVAQGGNTRLKCLQELYRETGDEQFECINCKVVPFSDHIQLMASHYIENENRAETLFIEKACIITEMLSGLRSHEDTYRSLSAKLKTIGLSVHYSSLPAIEYASTRLNPHIPKAMCAGMGRPTVQKLQLVEKAFKKVCQNFGIPSEIAETIFSDALEVSDSITFQVDDVMIAIREDKTLKTAVESKNREKLLLLIDIFFQAPADALKANISSIADDYELRSEGVYVIDHGKKDKQKKLTGPVKQVFQQSEKELRNTCYQIASKLADSYFNIGNDVKKIDFGYGFFLDAPDQPYQNQLVISFWWLLTSLSGVITLCPKQTQTRINAAPVKNIKAAVEFSPEHYDDILRRISALVGNASSIAILSMPDMLLTNENVTDDEFYNFNSLLSSIRDIKKIGGSGLWEDLQKN